MHTFISMLRGINVGGQKKIKMVDLRELYGSLGFMHVQSYVQSGNVVFDCEESRVVDIAVMIETRIEQFFGYGVSVFIRDAQDFKRIIDGNPFIHQRTVDHAKLHVTFLYKKVSEQLMNTLHIPEKESGEFSIGECELYLFSPEGYGKTRLSNSFFERKLRVVATTRNWKTVHALYNLTSGR